MGTYKQEKRTALLVVILAAILSLTGIPNIRESAFIISFLIAVYLITDLVIRKTKSSPRKRTIILVCSFCVLLYFVNIIIRWCKIIWPEVMIYTILVSGWPLFLYLLTRILEKIMPGKKAIRIILFFLAVAAGILLDIELWADCFSLSGGIVRPDHVLYFLIVAAVIAYKCFFSDVGSKAIRAIFITAMIVAIIVAAVLIFYYNPRWNDIVRYVYSGLSGRDADVDWIGYRISAFKAYWLHDFNSLHSNYPGEEAYWTVTTGYLNVLIKLAYYMGSWTTVVILALEIMIFVYMGKLYSTFRREGKLDSAPWRIWNAVPFLIVGYVLRTIIGLIEHMFLLSLSKMDLPFTGRGSIDLLIPIILLVSMIYGSEGSKEKRALIKHSTVRAAGLFIVFYLCINICVWLTGITWEKLDDEALQEKWYYNDQEEQRARTEAEENFPEKTGKEFLLTGVSKYPSEHGIRFVKWGVSTDGILYIRGYGSVKDLADSYQTAIQENGLKYKIKKAVVMDGIDSIGEDVFSNLPELKEIEIAGTVENIGQNAFSYCRKLEKVCLDGYRTSIYPDSFYNCGDLIKIVANHDALNDSAAYRTELEFVEKNE